jgi:succinyl-CoA synthetase beta subunit
MGIIADGAGSGMLTLDLVSDLGGSPKVYCEMGGEATPQLMENTMQAAMNVEGVKVVLINLIGGLNRMDEMAKGITSYVMKNPSKVPVVVRMSGTMENEGRSILASSKIQSFDNLYRAAQKAVKLSREAHNLEPSRRKQSSQLVDGHFSA